jgi:hypothetical protein
MKDRYTDEGMARHLLERRTGSHRSWRNYLIHAGVLAVGLVALVFFKYRAGWWFFIGYAVGAGSREHAWVSATDKVWSFYEKVIDWAKVEKIAAGGDQEEKAEA